jgi:hypothetical protein
MAGTIIADFIRTDASQLSLNVGNTTFATINASGFFSNTGTQLIAANGAISGASVIAGSISAGKLGAASVARTNMGYAGAVLQVVRSEYTTLTSTTSTSTYSNIGSATITPSSASNKILITVNYHVSGVGALRLLRGSTALNTPTGTYMFYSQSSASQAGYNAGSDRQTITMQFYDSPATTSSTTYNVEMIAYAIGGTTGIGVNEVHSGITFSGITLMEIAV